MANQKVRTKFTCTGKKQYQGTHWNPYVERTIYGMLYLYEFQAVIPCDTELDRDLLAIMPTGTITLSSTEDDLFVPGRNYYLTFEPVGGNSDATETG